ncbi:hypothetical protein T484DRAFT_1853205 [Baffinella frigidus]|nr:hypothetical protein T484DRAFT_1853205 [Cryptophyta sp. CCMP2293]
MRGREAEVASALRSLGHKEWNSLVWLRSLGHKVLEEWVEPKSGYALDVWLPDIRVAVEVDGPHHYTLASREGGAQGQATAEAWQSPVDGPHHYTLASREGQAGRVRGQGQASVEGAEDTPHRLGPTRMKLRHLRGLGVLCRTAEYLRRLLADFVPMCTISES